MWAVEAVADFDTETITTNVEMKILWLGFCCASHGGRGDDKGTGSCKGTALCCLNEVGH